LNTKTTTAEQESATAADSDARRALRDIFGYSEFRKSQEEIIANAIGGGDTMVLMPTGGGKSLCYQIPAIVRRGVGVVISPLLSLMKNQVDILDQNGARAARFDSSQSGAERAAAVSRLKRGDLDLLYVSPERALSDSFAGLLSSTDIALFAIDEAPTPFPK